MNTNFNNSNQLLPQEQYFNYNQILLWTIGARIGGDIPESLMYRIFESRLTEDEQITIFRGAFNMGGTVEEAKTIIYSKLSRAELKALKILSRSEPIIIR